MEATTMLKKNYEFRQVLTKGKHYSGKYIVAFIRENKKINKNFLGLAISTKLRKCGTEEQSKKIIKRKL